MATSYHQLGMLEHLRGNFDAAEQLYRKSLTIEDGLGNKRLFTGECGVSGRVRRR